MVCPFGAIRRERKIEISSKCDLCLGLDELACVSSCPTKALVAVKP